MIGIYKITSPSNKIYIGKSFNIINRFKRYKKLLCKEQPKLYRSFKKYGTENHIFEIIEKFDSIELKDLNNKEIYYIKLFNSKEKGLNCTNGGDGILGFKHTKETVKNMSDRLKGKPSKFKGSHHSTESKNKISLKNKGRKLSEQNKQIISKAAKNRVISKERKQQILKDLNTGRRNTSKKILNKLTNVVFVSATKAYNSESFSFSSRHFRRMLNNESPNHTNYEYK